MKGWGHSSRLQCLPGGSDNSEADTTRTRSTKGEDSSLDHIIIRSSTLGCNIWQASEANETLAGVYKFELVRYIYTYVWRYVCQY